MLILSSLVPEVVVITTSGADSHNKVGIMTTFVFSVWPVLEGLSFRMLFEKDGGRIRSPVIGLLYQQLYWYISATSLLPSTLIRHETRDNPCN